jgi:hypothetical protein
VPGCDYNARKEDTKRNLDHHHGYEVSRLANNNPLLLSVSAYSRLGVTDLRELFQPFITCDMRPTTVGLNVELTSRKDCEDHLQARQLRQILAQTVEMHTPASIIVASSHPKLAIIHVRVHTRRMMKNHARARNAIVILSDCSPA